MKRIFNSISFSDWFLIIIIIFQLGMSFAKLSFIEDKMASLEVAVTKRIDYVQEKIDTHLISGMFSSQRNRN